MTWITATVPHVKALHIGFVLLWIAGLVAMPRMLARHDQASRHGQSTGSGTGTGTGTGNNAGMNTGKGSGPATNTRTNTLTRTNTRTPDFNTIRHATHFGYVWGLTPVAVLAIVTGGTLVFLREVFTVWLFAKLVLVAGLVAVHAWIGHTISAVAETEGTHQPPTPQPPTHQIPAPLIPTLLICALVAGILLLVLAKPDLAGLPVPDWLATPRGRQLPFDMPSR